MSRLRNAVLDFDLNRHFCVVSLIVGSVAGFVVSWLWSSWLPHEKGFTFFLVLPVIVAVLLSLGMLKSEDGLLRGLCAGSIGWLGATFFGCTILAAKVVLSSSIMGLTGGVFSVVGVILTLVLTFGGIVAIALVALHCLAYVAIFSLMRLIWRRWSERIDS